uniref:SRR1 domain containing n=1 Tax=Rousettus aegyptiacus TaxID=9407 RepID=A0A7J8H7F8_ROUAE|nr:SRR1 domain containing [Rousettus aegyptiacus]
MAAVALEPWQAAAPRKRRSAARRPQPTEAAAAAAAPGREAEPEVDSGVLLRRIQKAGEDLLLSDFWSSALETINGCLTKHLEQPKTPIEPLSGALGNLHLDSPPDESSVAPGSSPGETLATGTCHWKCVCYGIGNFSTCVIARNQLTFLLLFLEKCQEGKRSVCGEHTIFYMLHCGTALYNNLLWSNWSVDALSKMIIIGNSFKGLEERLLTRILHKNYGYIAKAKPTLRGHLDISGRTRLSGL